MTLTYWQLLLTQRFNTALVRHSIRTDQIWPIMKAALSIYRIKTVSPNLSSEILYNVWEYTKLASPLRNLKMFIVTKYVQSTIYSVNSQIKSSFLHINVKFKAISYMLCYSNKLVPGYFNQFSDNNFWMHLIYCTNIMKISIAWNWKLHQWWLLILNSLRPSTTYTH